MGDYKVSVIMPVFNTAEESFSTALNSVLKQSYENIELIIVDDGSEKDFATLYDSLVKKDLRITLIHQKNGGVSSARNHGTRVADGDVVMYVDSDDILSTEAIAEGIDIMRKTGAQFVFAGIQQIYAYSDFIDAGRVGVENIRLFCDDEIDIVRDAFLGQGKPEFQNLNGIGEVNRGPVARLLQSSIAKQVLFDERLVIGEDVEWNMRVLNACDSVCLVKNSWYGYYISTASSLRKYYGNRDELLTNYLITLYNNNRQFCDNNIESFALNMSIAFYAYVKYELFAEACPFSDKEKERKVAEMLKMFPYDLLNKREIVKTLPGLHRFFLLFCKIGFGVRSLKLWNRIKS